MSPTRRTGRCCLRYVSRELITFSSREILFVCPSLSLPPRRLFIPSSPLAFSACATLSAAPLHGCLINPNRVDLFSNFDKMCFVFSVIFAFNLRLISRYNYLGFSWVVQRTTHENPRTTKLRTTNRIY